MDMSEIQARLSAMVKASLAKGKREPEATVFVNSDASPSVMLKWARTAADPERGYDAKNVTHYLSGDIAEILNNADDLIASLPSPEEAKMAEFTAHLAKTIELGHANGIDVEFVNPLTEAMKRLSENAITHQK